MEKQIKRAESISDPVMRHSYLNAVQHALDNRSPMDSGPYMVYVFNKLFAEHFGSVSSYSEVKTRFNRLVMNMEAEIEDRIISSADPLRTALLYARTGNYIDFAALTDVQPDVFIQLLQKQQNAMLPEETYSRFLAECATASTFLLLCDNCGEIVLDKLFLRQLKNTFPQLKVYAMVRGG